MSKLTFDPGSDPKGFFAKKPMNAGEGIRGL